ncbi:WD40 repeat domain-containing protein [Candidatus Parabeggiatoa sp. HSG14]|uniref:WD40 repeat domain-containing protein n=1 Tax=Candidatus Parabeggiatoa sp. HSG14 TaxID=3055593 RepID=UPI0025A6C69F|nr:WD40 repeat domain-containing protein [Thiotrichales bacterium HSG14]
MSENILSIMNGFNTVDFYQRVSGILKGNHHKTIRYLEKINENFADIRFQFERLSDQILYVPTLQSVRDISQSRQQYIDDLREVRASLEPVQQVVKDDILSSAMILTPDKMQKALTKSPWEVLMDIRPANLAAFSSYSDKTQVLFNYQGVQYIGWQACGTLPQQFDCQYDELWQPNISDSCSLLTSSDNDPPKNLSLLPSNVLHILRKHEDWVNSIAFSPNGRILASASEDRTIKLLNVSTGEELRTLKKSWWQKGHFAPVRTIAFSPDGRILASGSDDNTIKLWNVNTGKLIRNLQEENGFWVNSIAFNPNGSILATGTDSNKITLWDVRTGKKRHTLQGHQGEVKSVAFSPDGQTLASGSVDKTIKLWAFSTGVLLHTLKWHGDFVNAIVFSPDGQTLASASNDKTIKLWEVSTGNKRHTLLGHQQGVSSISFSPDGHILASGSSDDTIKLWEISTGNSLRTLQGHDCIINAVIFSPSGRTLVSASNDKTIKLWR